MSNLNQVTQSILQAFEQQGIPRQEVLNSMVSANCSWKCDFWGNCSCQYTVAPNAVTGTNPSRPQVQQYLANLNNIQLSQQQIQQLLNSIANRV